MVDQRPVGAVWCLGGARGWATASPSSHRIHPAPEPVESPSAAFLSVELLCCGIAAGTSVLVCIGEEVGHGERRGLMAS